jgi:rubrerythrin
MVLSPLQQALEKMVPHSSHQVLKVGIEFERRAIEMFDRIRKVAKNKESAKAVKEVLKIKKKHKKLLKIMTAYQI